MPKLKIPSKKSLAVLGALALGGALALVVHGPKRPQAKTSVTRSNEHPPSRSSEGNHSQAASPPPANANAIPSNNSGSRSLVAKILDSGAEESVRIASLFSLIHSPQLPLEALSKIAAAPLPSLPHAGVAHSADSIQRRTELSLRIRALEAIDQRSTESPLAAKAIERLSENLEEPSLRLLAQISLTGIQQGRPGKAHRFIELVLSGETNP